MEMRNTTFSRRTLVSFALAGLVTASLPLTSQSEPAPGETGAQPAIKVLTNPPAGAESQRLAGPSKPAPLPGLSKKISLDLRQMDILAVLKFLAEQGDFNIVPGKNVGGRVTLAVKDITIQDALDIIALTNELAYVVQSRVIHVMTEADYQRLFGGVFAGQPEVEKALTPKLGAVRLDKRTNTLVVTDLAPQMQEIRRVISAFDRKTREVVIQARIMEVRLSDQLQVGVDWEALFKTVVDVHVTQFFPIVPPPSASGKLILGTFASDKFRAVLELLQSVGKTNILSTPQIAVVENEEAKILVGTREAYVTSAVTQTTSASTTAEQVTFIDVGLQLKVLPTINEEGFVSMKIKPEVSSVSRSLTTAAGNSIPIVDTSSAETTVMVKDGTTLVIAGLMKDEKIGAEKKLPVLGDIPFLGALFRSRDDRRAKTELIFFLTPTIISGGESVGVTGTGTRNQEEKQEEKKEEKDGTKEE